MMGLLRLNSQDENQRQPAYQQLALQRCFEVLQEMDILETSQVDVDTPGAFRVVTHPPQEAHLRIPAHRHDGDFMLSLDLEEAGAGQLRLGFIVINDLRGPRFNIDVDEAGKLTLLGTAGRNVPEEIRAMQAGLGPCQVRRGLRMFAELLPKLEAFAQQQNYVAIVLEPLTYHNAIMYEHYGFAYIRGKRRMKQIDQAFQPGGVLHNAMDGSTPFRQPEMADDPRGRSWAIHDGILEQLDGNDHLDLEMVKVIGQMAEQYTFTEPK